MIKNLSMLIYWNYNIVSYVLTAATGTRISTNNPANACLISRCLTSRKYLAHSVKNWKDASKSSIGAILIRKNFMPIRRDIIDWVTKEFASFPRSSDSSLKNLTRTDANLAWANTPKTSAYKSAMTRPLAALIQVLFKIKFKTMNIML